MGGNALRHHTSTRLHRQVYEGFSQRCLERLGALYPAKRIDVIQAYGAKPDFGDCDILLESEGYNPFEAAEALHALEVVRNGSVTSLGVVVNETPGVSLEDNVFQVDLIAQDSAGYSFAKNYFAFNDLGNLIGRIAHKQGLSHGHAGLRYYVRDGSHLLGDILLTQDYDEALDFLGYNCKRYAQGFKTLDEVYEFAASTPYFNVDIFLLDNRNHAARVRDRKRKTYMGFLQWCEARPGLPAFDFPKDKSVWLARIAERFPRFTQELDSFRHAQAERLAIRQVFNGEVLSRLSGLQGKELGGLMSRFKESFESAEAFRDFVLSGGEGGIEQRVRELLATN